MAKFRLNMSGKQAEWACMNLRHGQVGVWEPAKPKRWGTRIASLVGVVLCTLWVGYGLGINEVPGTKTAQARPQNVALLIRPTVENVLSALNVGEFFTKRVGQSGIYAFKHLTGFGVYVEDNGDMFFFKIFRNDLNMTPEEVNWWNGTTRWARLQLSGDGFLLMGLQVVGSQGTSARTIERSADRFVRWVRMFESFVHEELVQKPEIEEEI